MQARRGEGGRGSTTKIWVWVIVFHVPFFTLWTPKVSWKKLRLDLSYYWICLFKLRIYFEFLVNLTVLSGWGLWSLWNSLANTITTLSAVAIQLWAGGGSVAMAVDISEIWHMTGDRWHVKVKGNTWHMNVTGDKWQMTGEKWHVHIQIVVFTQGREWLLKMGNCFLQWELYFNVT